jgi:dephospho-CoA kinase
MLRDGLTREQAMLRTAAQMPIDEKREHGDEVIDNSGTPKETHRQYEALLDRLRAEASILADIA